MQIINDTFNLILESYHNFVHWQSFFLQCQEDPDPNDPDSPGKMWQIHILDLNTTNDNNIVLLDVEKSIIKA